MRRAAALLAVLPLAVLAAGCGGSKTPPAQKWADQVCSAVLDWRSSLLDLKNEGGSGVEGFRAKLKAADEATKQLVDDLKAAGPPDTEAGQQAEDELRALADRTGKRVERVKARADALPSGNVTAFAQGVVTILREVQLVIADFQTSFDKIKQLGPKSELEDGFKQAESCQELERATEG